MFILDVPRDELSRRLALRSLVYYPLEAARRNLKPVSHWSDFMKAYVMTTGSVFGLLVVAHAWRAIEEGPHLATDPLYVLTTAAAAAFCLWAWRVLRLMPRTLVKARRAHESR